MHGTPPNTFEITLDCVSEYDCIIIVAGSRNFNDYDSFSEIMLGYLDQEWFVDKTICFVTGKAKHGADNMIIYWCEEFGWPWHGKPADWDAFGKGAGYIRNREMALISSHLITFWDGKSKGTEHMQDIAKKMGLHRKIILVDSDEVRAKLNNESTDYA